MVDAIPIPMPADNISESTTLKPESKNYGAGEVSPLEADMSLYR
jgi:hypothetical protein